jgi:hypothetical protein
VIRSLTFLFSEVTHSNSPFSVFDILAYRRSILFSRICMLVFYAVSLGSSIITPGMVKSELFLRWPLLAFPFSIVVYGPIAPGGKFWECEEYLALVTR